MADVRGKCIPELRSRATESSTSHGTEAGRGDREEDGRGGTKGARGDSSLNKICQIRRGKIVDSLECVEEYFKINSKFDGEPMEML